jgi:hypothetical protein
MRKNMVGSKGLQDNDERIIGTALPRHQRDAMNSRLRAMNRVQPGPWQRSAPWRGGAGQALAGSACAGGSSWGSKASALSQPPCVTTSLGVPAAWL